MVVKSTIYTINLEIYVVKYFRSRCMAATKFNLMKNACTLLTLMWSGVVPTKIYHTKVS